MNQNLDVSLTLSWGFGSVSVNNDVLNKGLPEINDYYKSGNIGVGLLYFENKAGKPYNPYSDFKNYEKRDQVFEYFGIDKDVDFDEFNKRFLGYTKAEYLNLIE